jgi:dinuclear metal center YbgI/SA1388 family protein
MSALCSEIIDIVRKLAPEYLVVDGDNTGFLIGDENSEVDNVMVTLDINEEVIKEAAENKVGLIITHHPVIYNKLASITESDFMGRKIIKLIKNNITVYSAHSSLDIAENGINDYLAEIFELQQVSVMEKTYEKKLYKISINVPVGYEDKVREAVMLAGGGELGNYRNCTYSIKGEGTFMPLTGASPFIGSVNKTEYVDEIKIETTAEEDKVKNIIKSIFKVHPYEMPSYEVYLLNIPAKVFGFGRIGILKNPVSLGELCNIVKEKLNLDSVNTVGYMDKIINKLGICSGSGGDLIPAAYKAGCDALLTGDIKYHDACDARDMGMAIIDAGHFGTENIYMDKLCHYINNEINKDKYKVNVLLSKSNKSPFKKL